MKSSLEMVEYKKSFIISCIAIMGAVHAILTSIPGIWRSWMIVIEPLEGVLLGPYGGGLAALVGSVIGRIIRPRRGYFPLFGISEPVGAIVSGLIIKGKWKLALGMYCVMLIAYFIHPLGRRLPAWCLWDIYIALLLIPVSRLLVHNRLNKRKDAKTLSIALAVTSFIGVEADTLTRIFLFIPLGLYNLMGVPEDVLPLIWIAGAVQTPIESAISVVTAVIVGVHLLLVLERTKIMRWPLT